MTRRTRALSLTFVTLLSLSQTACPGGDDGNQDFMDLLLQLFLVQTIVNSTSDGANCATNSDPFFSSQWHLSNTGQFGGTSGEDAKVSSLWTSGLCGNGIALAVVDDGLEIGHEDLKNNVVLNGSYNYLTGSTNPTSTSSGHGTSVAGVMAARPNTLGVRGASPLASLRGFNLLQSFTTANQADAMTRSASAVFISNNSWGPTDNTGQLSDADSTWRAAIDTGLSSGRGGKGILYSWAAGNGGRAQILSTEIDNSNYDGFANYYGVMAVCAIGQDGKRASYSEQGANLWVCAHSQGNDSRAIATTDLTGSSGFNKGTSSSDFSNTNYTNTFNGTSSAAPLAGGVAALVMEANANLTWRDVKLILAQSARQVDTSDTDWFTNGAGFKVNHKYGFGAVDGAAAVSLARSWTNVATLKTSSTFTASPGSAIADGAPGAATTSNIAVAGSGISQIEFVDVTVTINHPSLGDLRIILTPPAGSTIVSRLMTERVCRGSSVSTATLCTGSSANTSWRFGTARHLGEAANGTWQISVQDNQNVASLGAAQTACLTPGVCTTNGNGTLVSWTLKFYGR